MHDELGMVLHKFVVALALCVNAVAANPPSSSKDACLLQRNSLSQQLSSSLHEEFSVGQGKFAPAQPAKTSPKSGGKSTSKNRKPNVDGKKAPKSGAKTVPEMPMEITTTTEAPKRMISTAVEEISEDGGTSQRGELYLTAGLDTLADDYGSLESFADTAKASLLAQLGDEGDVDPDRLVILNIGGEYSSDSTPSERGDHVARVDFEMYPGGLGKPNPGSLLKRLVSGIRDMTGPLVDGPLKKFMPGAAMVVKKGRKSTPGEDSRAQRGFAGYGWNSTQNHGSWDNYHGKNSSHHHHKKSSKAAGDLEKLKDEEPSDTTEWYPWQYLRWIISGGTYSGARTTSAPWTAIPLLLALGSIAELAS